MESLEPIPRVSRIAVVTAGVSLTGGAVGALCGVVSLVLIAIVEGGIGAFRLAGASGVLAAAAGFGAIMGMIGAPVLSWALLRRVPLGRALVFTALGTSAGSVLGELTVPLIVYPTLLPGVIAGAVAGFLGAGIALHVHARRHEAGIGARAV